MNVITYDEVKDMERKRYIRSTVRGDLELFCYTSDTFFENGAWNEITESHRGKLYYKKRPVNSPFRKIFNLNERPETQESVVLERMKNEEYEIYDKANGHLFILSAFLDDEGEQQIVFHTKGSMVGPDNDLLNNDIEVFMNVVHQANLREMISGLKNITLCFEAIVEHDPHTLYESQAKQYGSRNTFVLLNADIVSTEAKEWNTMSYYGLGLIADNLNLPVVKRYDYKDGIPSEWLEDKGVEGYVIHFTEDNSRVKVKTKEYWSLRFKKDLTAEKILHQYMVKGPENFVRKLPEEVGVQIVEVIDSVFRDWYYLDYIKINEIKAMVKRCIHDKIDAAERKDIAVSTNYTTQQKMFLFTLIDDKNVDMQSKKQIRIDFLKDCHSISGMLDGIQSQIESIVGRIGVVE